MPAPLSALQLRRQDAVKRYLAGEPIEAICRELGCSKSWLYKWKPRYEAPEPTWSQERSRRPRTTPTKTPAAVEMAIVRLRESFSPGVSAQVIRDHLSRHQGESIPSRRTIARTLWVGEATGRLPTPAPGGWPCALPAASRPQDGERYRAYWRGVTGSGPQPAALSRSGPHWGRLWDHENCRRAGSEKQACYETDTAFWHTWQRRRRLYEKRSITVVLSR